MEDETRERVYNSDENDYVLRPKDNTNDIIKTKTEFETKAKTKPKTEDGPEAMLRHTIYTRIKYECKECHKEFRIKIALTTHHIGIIASI